MTLLKTSNLSACIRKMAIDGYIINVDHADVKNHAAQLQRIGGNVNQIVTRMNETGSLYSDYAEGIKSTLAEVWKLERRLMLKKR